MDTGYIAGTLYMFVDVGSGLSKRLSIRLFGAWIVQQRRVMMEIDTIRFDVWQLIVCPYSAKKARAYISTRRTLLETTCVQKWGLRRGETCFAWYIPASTIMPGGFGFTHIPDRLEASN